MRYGTGFTLTSLARSHPVEPLGRTGSSTRTQPSRRCCTTRNTWGTAVARLPGTTSHGLSRTCAGVTAIGRSKTSRRATVAVATDDPVRPAGRDIVVVGEPCFSIVVGTVVAALETACFALPSEHATQRISAAATTLIRT